MSIGMKRVVDSQVYRLKVTLRGSRPAIWRRLEVGAGVSLFQLHDILQLVMGWTDSHLHQFRRGSTYYGLPDPEMGMDRENERRVHLGDVLRRPKDRMVYEYDFGDGWMHEIQVDEVRPKPRKFLGASCEGGARACPPEDCGGASGYAEFLEALRDPKHEQHEELLEWISGKFDPEAFDREKTNRALRRLE